jgi:hypothetical protein
MGAMIANSSDGGSVKEKTSVSKEETNEGGTNRHSEIFLWAGRERVFNVSVVEPQFYSDTLALVLDYCTVRRFQ